MDEDLKTLIIEELTELVINLASDVNLRPMYGGTVIELIKDDPKSRVGGFYSYAEHVSLELAKGVSFDDPKALLEGKGKFRRHVKIRMLSDICSKDCEVFLKQAIASL